MRRSLPYRLLCLLAALALAVLGTGFVAGSAAASASTLFVATDGDDTDNGCTDSADPCQTIQHAVDKSAEGDTVSIAAGTYHESVLISESLTLQGAGTTEGSAAPVIDGADNPSITVQSVDTVSDVTLDGLDVSGNQTYDGIDLYDARATVTRCVVSKNAANGVAVFSSQVDVTESTISDNGNNGIYAVTNSPDQADNARGLDEDGASVTVTESSVNSNGNEGIDLAYGGSATVESSTMQDNVAGGAVAVYDAELDITNSTLDGNGGTGAFYLFGSSGTITASTVSDTTPNADYASGVRTENSGFVTIDTSTIYGSAGQGVLVQNGLIIGPEAEVAADDANVTIENSTISGTRAPAGEGEQSGGEEDVPYGGIVVAAADLDEVRAESRAAGLSAKTVRRLQVAPADRGVAAVAVVGSIDAANADLDDCAGDTDAIEDDGYNLSSDSDSSCGFTATGSVQQADPRLGPLADNGGRTETLRPAKGSPAIDAVPTGDANCNAEAIDQRGVARPQGPACDIGAVEVDQPPVLIAPDSLPDGMVGQDYTAQISASGGLGAPYEFSLASGSGPLPPGLSLDTSGLVHGTPTQAGTYPITVSVDDPTLKDYVIVITAPSTSAPPTTTAPPSTTPPPTTGPPTTTGPPPTTGPPTHSSSGTSVTPPPVSSSSSGGPIAITGTPVLPLGAAGGIALLAGILVLVAAGWFGGRPGRHRRPRRAH